MEWTAADAASWITVPGPEDDKYSRGVLGLVTGSASYPGAGVIGAEAALHTGVGMLRYLGGAPDAVLARRPEVVTVPGQVQAWVLGSGIPVAADRDGADRDHADAALGERIRAALADGVPTVLDAGALPGPGEPAGADSAILTPHAGELARLLGTERERVLADPAAAAREAAERTGAVVLLKGHTTRVAAADLLLEVTAPTTWLATAGTGDALGGILGALLATAHARLGAPADPADLARVAASAALIHGVAALRAGRGGPITVLHLCHALPVVITELLALS